MSSHDAPRICNLVCQVLCIYVCRSGLTAITVDTTIPDYLNTVISLGISMLVKFVAVVILSPVFLLPGIAAFMIGALAGQIYIKAQLSIKREMSVASAPVLSHFGAAIAGIGACILYV